MNSVKNESIEEAITQYLNARSKIIELGRIFPEEIGGNDNIIGRIGEYIGLQFLRGIGQNPKKAISKSNQGYDFFDGDIFTQVKVITSENERGRNVRLKKPWTQLVLIELAKEYIPNRIGLITDAQHKRAIDENPSWSLYPIVKLTMLSSKGLIGKYGKVYLHNEIII